MVYSLIIAGIVLGGLLTIVCIVFAIISLANGKNKNAIIWGSGFLISVLMVTISIFMLFRETAARVRDTFADLAAQNKNYDVTSSLDDEYSKNERQYWLDTLQKYTNTKYDGKVPADFYINKTVTANADGTLNVPFVYPYYIKYNPTSYTGDIMMETSDSIFVKNITSMVFDENFALIKVDNSMSPDDLSAGRPETEYLLYDLRTRNYESAANMEKLLDLGRRIGYTGSTDLSYLSESYRGWNVSGSTY